MKAEEEIKRTFHGLSEEQLNGYPYREMAEALKRFAGDKCIEQKMIVVHRYDNMPMTPKNYDEKEICKLYLLKSQLPEL